jgi:hypothetical protein
MLAANLALAVLVILPLREPMSATLDAHPEAARIGRRIDVRWWTDWTVGSAAIVSQSVNLLGAASLVMVLAGTFFAGGLLEALRHGPKPPLTFEPLPDPFYRGALPEWRAAAPKPASIQVFLKESARHFPRFLVFLILSLPCYWIVQTLLNWHLLFALDGLLEEVEDERLGLLLTVARFVLFVAAFHVVTVLFEYVRAAEILKPGAPLLGLLGVPFGLLRTRPGTLLGIEAGAVLLQTAAMLAFIPVDRALARWPLVAATAGFAATQVFLFVRLWLRASAQAAQIRLAEMRLSSAAPPASGS